MGLSMKNLTLVCEARLMVQENANEAENPSGKIEARVTTWGAREGADGRKFNYQPEGFIQWAAEFAADGKPLPMFLNHNDMGMPIGEWNQFEFGEDGMTAQGRLYLNTVGGSDVYTVMKESPNMFGGVSVGAYADEYQWVKEDGSPMTVGSDDPYTDGYFQITKGGLREVSVVMYPNNDKAEVMKLECFDARRSFVVETDRRCGEEQGSRQNEGCWRLEPDVRLDEAPRAGWDVLKEMKDHVKYDEISGDKNRGSRGDVVPKYGHGSCPQYLVFSLHGFSTEEP